MGIETTIHLNKFKARPYQKEVINSILRDGKRKAVLVWHRGGGKDITCLQICIDVCLSRPCIVYYLLPEAAQARKVIWDAVTMSGEKFLDYIPPEVIKRINQNEMKIVFHNDAILQFVGSDRYNSLMGTNPYMCVWSEYALSDPRSYIYLRPRIAMQDGIVILNSTPRGKNHLYTLWQAAINSDEWFTSLKTIEDTQAVSLSKIQRELHDGIISEDYYYQEYFCSFERGIEGAVYARYIDKMRLSGQIGLVPWEPAFPVWTASDIGRDTTSIIFAQTIGTTVRVIDYEEKKNENLEWLVNTIRSKPYTYNDRFYFPHDMEVTEWAGPKFTRVEKARQLGLKARVVDKVGLEDGIEYVKSQLPKIWIDEKNCSKLIKCLESYHFDWDAKREVYSLKPVHDWASHGCFTGDTMIFTRNGMRPIMLIEKDEEILTLEGWVKCNKATLMKQNANLVEVKFVDGTTVRCTPDHLFLTESGWRSAESLTNYSKIQSSLMSLHGTLMDRYIDYFQMKDISLKVGQDYIEMFGNSLLVKYLKDVTYTIKTMMLAIIDFITWNACQQMITCASHNQIVRDFLIKPEKQQLNGMALKLEDCGTKDTLSGLKVGRSGSESQENVYIAGKYSTVLLEPMDTSKNIVIQTANPLHIESVRRLDEKEDVYCINVPQIHHFSLSNGAIVHNSDAFRYMCLAIPKSYPSTTPEELDKRYREALGYDDNLPDFFRD